MEKIAHPEVSLEAVRAELRNDTLKRQSIEKLLNALDSNQEAGN